MRKSQELEDQLKSFFKPKIITQSSNNQTFSRSYMSNNTSQLLGAKNNTISHRSQSRAMKIINEEHHHSFNKLSGRVVAVGNGADHFNYRSIDNLNARQQESTSLREYSTSPVITIPFQKNLPLPSLFEKLYLSQNHSTGLMSVSSSTPGCNNSATKDILNEKLGRIQEIRNQLRERHQVKQQKDETTLKMMMGNNQSSRNA